MSESFYGTSVKGTHWLLINFLRSLYRNLSAHIARKCASLNSNPKIATSTLENCVTGTNTNRPSPPILQQASCLFPNLLILYLNKVEQTTLKLAKYNSENSFRIYYY